MTRSAFDTPAKLQRAKERLYVCCQLGGWGAFMLVQLGLTSAFSDHSSPRGRDSVTDTAVNVMVTLMGLLLTHAARPLVTRWQWKQLRWLPLVPRVLGMATVLALIWIVAGYGYCYGLIGLPWPSKYNFISIMALSWFQSTWMMVFWFCVYFFYHIYERLQRMQIEQLRLAANVKEAELRALKSQVNPHFLFNSLNSLRALIDEDAGRAREAVTRLANILRYSLQSGQVETVQLRDELQTVEDYLALEQIRHEERLRVRWEVADEARSQLVPPMLLQTLVENAVKYGISTRRAGGEVAISAWIQDAALHLRVSNPGELAPLGNAASAKAGSSTGVGLRNASERLKLLYGDQATLQLVAEPAGSVTAEVSLPCRALAS